MKEGGGVIVECFVSGGGEREGESKGGSLSCSGIYLGNGLILTHGTIVTDILQHPASQPILRVLESGGWVMNEECKIDVKRKVHYSSHENQECEIDVKRKVQHPLSENQECEIDVKRKVHNSCKNQECKIDVKGKVHSSSCENQECEIDVARKVHNSSYENQLNVNDKTNTHNPASHESKEGTRGWVGKEGYKVKHKQADNPYNQLSIKGKTYVNDSPSQENHLRRVINVTQARFQVILPNSHNKSVKESQDTSTVQDPSHKQLILKDSQDQDGSRKPGCLTHNSQLRNIDQKVKKNPVQVYEEFEDGEIMRRTTKHSLTPSTIKGNNLSQSHSYSVPAYIERLFCVPSLRKKIEDLMPASEGWKFSEGEEDGKESKIDIETIILSSFVVLRISPKVLGEVELVQAVRRMLACSSHIYKGANIYIESSPFGSLCPDMFLNSVSRGVISNTSLPLLLTDARCILGSEGAPVLFFRQSPSPKLVGMVISPFFWRQGEWLGITLLAAIQPVLYTLLHTCQHSDLTHIPLRHQVINEGEEQGKASLGYIGREEDLKGSEEMLMKGIRNSVVGVWGGNKWGSGVVVSSSPPLILTCAHVTQPAKDGRVTIVVSDGRNLSGKVLHQTQPIGPMADEGGMNGGSMWDLAVVGVSQPLPPPLTLSKQLPQIGGDVMVVGYGMFSPSQLPSPSFSRGVVSKLITAPLSSLIWPSYPRVQPYLAPEHPRELVVGHVNKSYTDLKEDSKYPKQDRSNNETSLKQNIIANSQGYSNTNTSKQGYSNTNTSKSNNHISRDLSRQTEGQRHTAHKGSVAVMMQTTCSVYAGSSGGPVIAIHPTLGPVVVGIITCNIQSSEKKCTFPNINIAAPTPIVAKIIDAFIKTLDVRVLQLLDVACPEASRLWSLSNATKARL